MGTREQDGMKLCLYALLMFTHQPPGSYTIYRVSVYNLLCALLGDQGELHRAALLEFTFRQKTDPGHVNKQTL